MRGSERTCVEHMLSYCVSNVAGDAPHFHTTSDKKRLGGGLGTGLVVSISVHVQKKIKTLNILLRGLKLY